MEEIVWCMAPDARCQMLYRLTCRSGIRLVFRAGPELINLLPPWFHRRSHKKYASLRLCVCTSLHSMKWILLQKLFCLRMFTISRHGSLLMRDCTSIFLVSSLWAYIMAKEHVCQSEDKLKQDVPAPRSFEGVPHHTSDSVEGRSITIKGHSVYPNLPVSACQMFQSFSFISSHEPYFYFYSTFFALHVTLMRKRKVNFLLLEGGEAKIEHCFICFRKLAEIEGFG